MPFVLPLGIVGGDLTVVELLPTLVGNAEGRSAGLT